MIELVLGIALVSVRSKHRLGLELEIVIDSVLGLPMNQMTGSGIGSDAELMQNQKTGSGIGSDAEIPKSLMIDSGTDSDAMNSMSC